MRAKETVMTLLIDDVAVELPPVTSEKKYLSSA